MLYSLDGDEICELPKSRVEDFKRWMQRITQPHFDAVVDAINRYIDPLDYFIAGYIPGKDWTGTDFQPVYEACKQSEEQAGWFFGLIVWKTVIDRDDKWIFKPGDKDADDFHAMTYFRKR